MKSGRITPRAVLSGILAVSLTASILTGFSFSTKADYVVDSYESQIAELDRQQEEAEAKRAEAQQNLDDAKANKEALEESIAVAERKQVTYSSMIVELDKQIQDKKQEIEDTEKAIEETRQKFLSRAASMYEDRDVSYLSIILGADDITDFLTKLDDVSTMLEYDKNLVKELKDSKASLNESLADLEEAKEAQEDALESLNEEKTNYSELLAEATSAESEYQSMLTEAEQEAYAAKAAEAELDAELTAYLAELQRQEEERKAQEEAARQQGIDTPSTNTVSADGFTWPLNSGDYYYISSHFGGRYLNGSYDYHPATDIAATEGTQIHAAGNGTVVRAEWNDSYGYYVLIDHGNGYSTLYAHQCQPPYVSAGDTVSIGEVIGLVGNTGYSFGSHLHFEFRVGGEKVDPEAYITPPHQ